MHVAARRLAQRIPRHHEWYPYCDQQSEDRINPPSRDGSIIIIIATDAPLLPHQLRRLAKRPSLGLGRLGAISGDGSGDIFVAFSTANKGQISENETSPLTMYPNNRLSQVFEAAVQATEEAIVNAMVAAETVIGAAACRKVLPDPEFLAECLRCSYCELAAAILPPARRKPEGKKPVRGRCRMQIKVRRACF